MHVRRLLVGCLTALLAATPMAAGPAWSDDPSGATLVVPADPSGDVVVTATADPAAAPYVQVKLVRGTTVSAPYEQIDAIDPAPVANPDGTPVPVTVPTWGLRGVDATFALLGCTSSDPTTCTTLLASPQTRAISQPVVPTAAWTIPASPVFWPQQDVTVKAFYDGGGRLLAHGTFARGAMPSRHVDQPLEANVTASLRDLPADSSAATYDIEVCSDLVDDPGYCSAITRRSFDYVGAASLGVVRRSRATVIADPRWSGSAVDVLVYHPGGDYQMSWVLRDAGGRAVSTPVDPGGDHGTFVDEETVVPAAVVQDLSDGAYSLDFTATYSKSGMTATATGSTQVQVVNDPPADHPEVTVVRRTARPQHGYVDDDAARFLVQAYPNKAPGTVRIHDSAGRKVATQRTWVTCGADGCGWDVHVYPYADDGNQLAPGRYTATLEMPDSYGRPMTVDLGEVDVQHVVHRQRTVEVAARRAVVEGAGFVGRCAAVVRPGTLQHRPGSLGLVSHATCSRSSHRADVAQQVFRVRVPRLATADELAEMDISAVVHGTDRRVVNTFPTMRARWEGASRWSRPHGLFSGPGWKPTGWQRSSSRPNLQGRRVDVRVAVDHGVRADVDKVGLRIDYYVWRTPRS